MQLDGEVNNVADADVITKSIMAIINQVINTNIVHSSGSLSRDEFEAIVKQLYTEQKVLITDDLQKNRWGGKTETNNKRISATVTLTTGGVYKVKLQVRFTKAEVPLKGNITFFLHNTFEHEIEYVVAQDNLATVELGAYEAFTAGAYTEDGTLLELDLQQHVGYPKGFYYKDVSLHFKNEIRNLYRMTAAVIKDDIQKYRWGGKEINNDKRLKVTVTGKTKSNDFEVVILVTLVNNSQEISGDVAFFLPGEFGEEIKFQPVIDGVAQIHLTASKTFTVGAYTQDGTMLEMDLEEQSAYPADFYKKKFIQAFFKKRDELPLKFKQTDKGHLIKFSAEENWWYYSQDLFQNTIELEVSIRKIIQG